ncbi:carbohydrate kinase family protein [Pseudodesulfovibrio tunisiensis]|uniref:carbohydrate kinase family protein n=1 Tax=Pseudodesulfovibrio tunisiensis TaxID=463192 RepID=UPI001FB39CEF|nr:carbohydrate kinase family protein [Pseudodesulfovibrio tunisiensis]
MQVYITGSLAFDRIMTFPGRFSDHILPDKIHIMNVCFVGNGLDEKFGGTAGNIAYSMAQLGEKPVILSQVGRDFSVYDERLQKLGLPVEGIRTLDHEFTAGAHITTDMADNQITCFNPGAMCHSCGYDMTGLNGDSIGIVSPGNVEDMVNHPKYYRENNIRFIFDPGQQITTLGGEKLKQALEGAYMLIVNDYELQMVMNDTGYSKTELLDKVGMIVTTLGENGCMVNNGEEMHIPAARPVAVVDPTGAGDAFRAGLLKGLCLGKDVETACRMGCVSALYSVETRGTQEFQYTWEDFKHRYEENYGPLA